MKTEKQIIHKQTGATLINGDSGFATISSTGKYVYILIDIEKVKQLLLVEAIEKNSLAEVESIDFEKKTITMKKKEIYTRDALAELISDFL